MNNKLLIIGAVLIGVIVGASASYVFVQAMNSDSNVLRNSIVKAVSVQPALPSNSSVGSSGSAPPYYSYPTYTFSFDSWVNSLSNVYRLHLEGFNETLVYETQPVYLSPYINSPPIPTPFNVTLSPIVSKTYIVIYIGVLDKNGDMLYLKNVQVTMWDQDFKKSTSILTINGEVWINTTLT